MWQVQKIQIFIIYVKFISYIFDKFFIRGKYGNVSEEILWQEFSANDIDEREIYFIEIWSKMNDEL